MKFKITLLSLLLLSVTYSCTKSDRKISSSAEITIENISTKGSPEMKTFVDELGSIKNSVDLANIVNKHVAVYETALKQNKLEDLPQDYLFFTSLLEPISSLRGIAHRVYGLFEKNAAKAGGYNGVVFREFYTSRLQAMASFINTYYPSNGRAYFEFFTRPYKGVGKSFSSTHEIQNFMMGDIYPKIQNALVALDAVGNIEIKKPIAIDANVFVGKGADIAEGWRYTYINNHEVSTIKAQLHQLSHDLIIFAQYDRDQLFGMKYKKNVKMVGYVTDAFYKKPGYSLVDIDELVQKYPSLYTMRNIPFAVEGGGTWMEKALTHLRIGSTLEKDALDQVKEFRNSVTRQVAFHSLLDGQLAYFATEQNYEMNEKRAELLNGQDVMIRNLMTGETALINYANYYLNPPKDLKEFLPIKYDKKGERFEKIAGAKIPNFFYGQPTTWNVDAYQRYFPSVKSSNDIPALVRTLASSPRTSHISRNFGRFVARTTVMRLLGLAPW